ncbi:hypothetical protein AQS8620_01663 [Aquimixticola soesokkakensis]|uniref:Tellurium resistance protein n=1 Tax=Aquimixticola soesokkakensis TaxID=1519096 RepID=A0A1Y5SJ82_9RHOB|nr:TrgA family protein [Aquimixticola soesokkakensis]SLN42055.1 hypothetical protein AQS8620_01663 [Aquimixticola soesokkakensis]
MPTASKLVAALWFAGLAWFSSQLVKPYMPEGTGFGWFCEVCAGIGFLIGWVFLGKRAGDTMRAALGYGLTASLLTTAWALFLFSGREMILRALARRYDGPMEAIIATFELVKDYAIVMAKPDVLGALIVGGLIGGWLVERTARSWS